MDKIQQLINQWRSSGLESIRALSTAQKIAIGIGIATIIGLATALTLSEGPKEYSYLYRDLKSDDIVAITDELNKMGQVDFIADSKGIKVPPDQIVPLRLKLAQEGLPTHGQIGWEKFDQQDFTKTEFEQNIQKLRAIQGELVRTINQIDGVNSSRIHLTSPKKSLFIEDQEEPTAAIYLKMNRGLHLDSKQINGIVHLVSRSIEGLRPEKITIIDQEGKMLTKIENEDPTSKRQEQTVAYKKNQEKTLTEKVRTIVSRITGPERVDVKVNIDFDFTEEEQTISDIDPDKVVVLASNTTNQQMDGNGLNPTGIPGSKSNVPGEQQDLTVNSSRAKSSRNSERLNYEIAKTKKHRLMPVGEIKRISVAVIVDGVQPYPLDGTKPVFEPRAKDEMKKIEDIVKSTIGYKEGRDAVTVENIVFELAPYQIEAIKDSKEENRNYIATLAVSATIALGLVLLFAFVVRPYFRWLSYDPERKARESQIDEYKPDLEMGSIQSVQVKEDVPFEKLSPQEQILFLAKNEPERTTEAIRLLLNPHHNAG